MIAALAVVAIAGGFWALGQRGLGAPAPDLTAAVVQETTSLPPSVFAAVGSGGLPDPLKSAGTAPSSPGKPLVIYVGAEYCPFCAAERWSVVVALSRFGTFPNLALSSSSGTDAYPNTPTFSFRKVTYVSQYIDFSAVETSDREQRPLAARTAAQLQAMSRYDPSGSIPFLDLGDRYTEAGSGYSPDVLAGSDWKAISGALKDPAVATTKAIVGNANYIVAATCRLTGDQPATVCSEPVVQRIDAGLG